MRPSVCPECSLRLHCAGNFYVPHSKMFHIYSRLQYRRSWLWRALLAGVVVRAIMPRRRKV